jgi:hypothetical protein
MKAHVGDWLVIKGTTIDKPDQRGLITEVHSSDGSPPYIVEWLADGHLATVFPGPDALIVTAAEQRASDERARSRITSMQAAIHQKVHDDHAR